MLTLKQIEELRTHLKTAENPLFFYDDDPDGICSYLLLKKYVEKGKGVILKASPRLDINLKRKLEEHYPDKIFVLDIPIITQEFIDIAKSPIYWIDHHPPLDLKGVHYYNPLLTKPIDNKPVSYYCYKITEQSLWLSVVGCIADHFIPEFLPEFIKKYPDLLTKESNIDDIIFKTKLGELIKVFSFIAKGDTSDVNKSISIISKIDSPYEIINQETPRGKYIYKKVQRLYKEYNKVLRIALSDKPKDKVFFFQYANKNSFTSELAGELLYRFPDKIVVVAREKSGQLKLSFRSKKISIRSIIEECMQGIEGYAGGHEHACGGNIAKEDFSIFMERFREKINRK